MAKRRKGEYSDRFNEDYEFYLANKGEFTFFGREIASFELCREGDSAKEAFWQFDTHGKIIPCREPELLKELIRCKKSVNWQIKEWADGYYEVLMPFREYMDSFVNPPAWVSESLERAASKKWKSMSKDKKEKLVLFVTMGKP